MRRCLVIDMNVDRIREQQDEVVRRSALCWTSRGIPQSFSRRLGDHEEHRLYPLIKTDEGRESMSRTVETMKDIAKVCR
jgi:hypothetical protein